MARSPSSRLVASWASLAGGIGALLLPKCPACFAAYGGGLTALGLSPVVQQRLAGPLLATVVLVSFALVLRLSLSRGDYLTPLASATGAALVLAGAFAFHRPAVVAVGATVLLVASIVNSARCRAASAG